jgi:hypothetical protein
MTLVCPIPLFQSPYKFIYLIPWRDQRTEIVRSKEKIKKRANSGTF